MVQKKYSTEHCKMCNNQTTHEDYLGKELDRCMACLLTKDQIELRFSEIREFTSFREEIYVAGDPDY